MRRSLTAMSAGVQLRVNVSEKGAKVSNQVISDRCYLIFYLIHCRKAPVGNWA